MLSAQTLDPATRSSLSRSGALTYFYLRPASVCICALVFAELVPHTPHFIRGLPFQAQGMQSALWAHQRLTHAKGELQLEKHSRKSRSRNYKGLTIYQTKLLITRRTRQKRLIGTVSPRLPRLICMVLPAPWELTLPVPSGWDTLVLQVYTAHNTSGVHSLQVIVSTHIA